MKTFVKCNGKLLNLTQVSEIWMDTEDDNSKNQRFRIMAKFPIRLGTGNSGIAVGSVGARVEQTFCIACFASKDEQEQVFSQIEKALVILDPTRIS